MRIPESNSKASEIYEECTEDPNGTSKDNFSKFQ